MLRKKGLSTPLFLLLSRAKVMHFVQSQKLLLIYDGKSYFRRILEQNKKYNDKKRYAL
jgi:hypothetical protein